MARFGKNLTTYENNDKIILLAGRESGFDYDCSYANIESMLRGIIRGILSIKAEALYLQWRFDQKLIRYK